LNYSERLIMFNVDWKELLIPGIPLLETFLRGTLVYLTLFAMLRFVPNRQIGAVGLSDLLLVVLVANAVQNALADDYKSITDGLILVMTIFFWSYALNWLGYRFPRLQNLLRSRTLPLIQDGRLIQHNMRRELITEEELKSHLRLQGIEDVSAVKMAHMEADGRISVVPIEQNGSRHPPERPTA
jgi:uncharacterized membrane protein YcaP (DUF421 family)